MQATDTRSPTAVRSPSDVDPSTYQALKTIALVFVLMMLATTLAFGMTPGAAALTTVTVLTALVAAFALTQPIIRWMATHKG